MSRTIETERLIIYTPDVSLTEGVLSYYKRNKEYFENYEPTFPDVYYTYDYQYSEREREVKNMENGSCAYYYYALKEEPDVIIGSISYIRFRREPYASVIFGYDQDEMTQGKGYCTEACRASMEDVFEHFHVHRIESRVLTNNHKSINLLKRLGFGFEGIEKSSILINGKFRDHHRYSYINEDY